MHIIDAPQRQQALDINQSFIVQAPAGSGKTELLTQRFLALLAAVTEPEEIIAITFTKKAASEMRNRILNALEQAAYQPEPINSNSAETWRLARRAILHSEQRHWNILANPNRLRVQTIDSLCANLANQMPIMARLGSQANIIEDADELYQQAANNLLATLEENPSWLHDLSTLLLHLDNNHERAVILFVEMLKKRNQWLPHVVASHQQHELRKLLEKNLEAVIIDALMEAHQYLTPYLSQLISLINFSRDNLQLTTWKKIPELTADQLEHWQYVANLLLTDKFTWRKTLTIANGFPAKSTTKEQTLVVKEYKKQMENLLQEFSSNDALRTALQKILQCPPAKYNDNQWSILNNLLKLLPILVAQLYLVFQQSGKIDFTALTQAALEALGDLDSPSELALRLDYKIQHLLIDEFQDTSATQYHLIERLTAGWQPGDGHSLFLVGDPMQSIYSFRAAEVGLFLRAQRFGIGNIPLTLLKLQVNFRSHPAIVNWVNTNFEKIFPITADIVTGAIPISPATAHHENDESGKVVGYQHHPEVTFVNEAKTIVEIIKNAPVDASIAILVKTKNQFSDIIPELQKATIAYQAIEIERLAHLAVIQDLCALTAALSHFADRLAWLSILRAPWCALTLNDLHKLSAPQHKTIWDNLNNSEIIANLSTKAQEKLYYFLPKLQNILNERGRISFADWVHSAWLLLGGPAAINDSSDLTSIEAFFELLFELEQSERFSIENLYQRIDKLFAKSTVKANVQLMTIHKAKGLEFDIVILPGLEQGQQHDANKLLLWLEKPRADSNEDFLLAPIKSKADMSDAIYDYVRLQHKIKQEYEASRLLYVAATRAKKQLYLLATTEAKPRAQSFLSKLWPTCQEIFTAVTTENDSIIVNTKPKLVLEINQPIKLPIELTEKPVSYHAGNRPKYENYSERYLEIALCEMLFRMSQIPKEQWPTLLVNKAQWLAKLRQLGVLETELAYNALMRVTKICAESSRAIWLLQQKHSFSKRAMTGIINNELRNIIIERMFIAEGSYWIIDYKVKCPTTEQNIEDFLQQQKAQHLLQLTNYAKILQKIEHYPIKLGLYFPLCDQWISWDHIEETSHVSYI